MASDLINFDLLKWRKQMGWNQREAAEALCIDTSTLRRREQAGKATPAMAKLATLMLRLRELSG